MNCCSINKVHKNPVYKKTMLTMQNEPKTHFDKKTSFLLNGIVISSALDWLLRSHPINKQANSNDKNS